MPKGGSASEGGSFSSCCSSIYRGVGAGGGLGSQPREHMCWVGVERGRTEMPKLVKAWPLPISDTLEALSSLHPELGCSGVDEKEEKLLDKKKFEKKK